MKDRPDDRCTTRTVTGHVKNAAGVTVFLVEELSDARMRCAQLKKLVAEATDLVEKSERRDHLFEVAAHLIHGIPDALFRLEKALDAAAMTASRMDYEEIKQTLRPEKADEMDQVLQDARLRYLNRRSQQLTSPTAAATEIERIASVSEQTGQVPVGDLLVLAAALEHGVKTAMEEPQKTAAERLRAIAQGATAEKSRVALAAALRSFLAGALQPTAGQALQAVTMTSNSREEVMEGFKQSNPDLTEEQLKTIADQWEANKHVVKEKAATTEIEAHVPGMLDNRVERLLGSIETNVEEMQAKMKRLGGFEKLVHAGGADTMSQQVGEIVNACRHLSRTIDGADAAMMHTAEDKQAAKADFVKLYHQMQADLDTFDMAWTRYSKDPVQNKHKLDDALKYMHDLRDLADVLIRNMEQIKAGKQAAVDKSGKFEEGEPADPTKDMSEEDAKKWRAMKDEHGDNFKASTEKTAFVPDALSAERVTLYVESMRERLLIAQRALKVGDWRHFKISLKHLTADMASIFMALGMVGASDKLGLVQRELMGVPLGSSGGEQPAARVANIAIEAWEAHGATIQADSREKVMEGFKEANPDLTEDQLEEIADHWEANKHVVKEKADGETAKTAAEEKLPNGTTLLVEMKSAGPAAWLVSKDGKGKLPISIGNTKTEEEAVEAAHKFLKGLMPKSAAVDPITGAWSALAKPPAG